MAHHIKPIGYRYPRLVIRFALTLSFFLQAATCTHYAPAQQQQLLSNTETIQPRLNFSSPSPQIFHSTFSLLQQWPNTFFPNGHTIAPCTIPKHTRLYHARIDDGPPPSPEWFAFDAAMSYAILGLLSNSHLLTYRTVRDVKCIYFDGMSASLMQTGHTESQTIFLHNTSANVPEHPGFGPPPRHDDDDPPPRHGDDVPSASKRGEDGPSATIAPPSQSSAPSHGFLQAEYDRATGLCDFITEKKLGGPGWGYEGIVRMNAGFELIWCNFSSPSIRLVSNLNVSAPSLEDVLDDRDRPRTMQQSKHDYYTYPEPLPYGPPRKGHHGDMGGNPFPGRENPFSSFSQFSWFRSATKRYGFTGSGNGYGETRVKINSGGLFSFYDPALADASSAVAKEAREDFNLTSEGYWKVPDTEEGRKLGLLELGRRRRIQRAVNVSEADGIYMRTAVEQRMQATLDPSEDECSGIDWPELAQELVSIYSAELWGLRSLLLSDGRDLSGETLRTWLSHARVWMHDMFMPYYEYPVFSSATLDSAFSAESREARAALELCKTQFEPEDLDSLSTSDRVTYTSVFDVLTGICSTLLPIFLQTEVLWLRNFNNETDLPPSPSSPIREQVIDLTRQHRHAVEELMAWLGWVDQWTTCNPGCGIGEVCYIPIWPVMGMRPFGGKDNGTSYGRRRGPGGGGMNAFDTYLWEPQCVNASHWPPG